MPRIFIQASLCLSIALLIGCSKAPQEKLLQGKTMGTSWSVKVIEDGSSAEPITAAAIQARLDDIENALSNWIADSDVSRLNQMATGCLLVSEHTEAVATAANLIAQQSQGYFDATLSPLIELWGFGVQGEPPQEPSVAALEAAMAMIDYESVSTTERQLCKQKDATQVNYSAIAKGYAVDQLAALLTEQSYSNFLVEVGGELYGAGSKADGEFWTVGVEQPSYGFSQELYSTLHLNGEAVATSGDYRNFYELDSVRYSHIIDPKTGRPVAHSTASVTVIDDSAMVADAWATAILAAGPEQGMALAEQYRLKVLMILHEPEGFGQLSSSLWQQTVAGNE